MAQKRKIDKGSSMWDEVGRTARYALGSNSRAVRLAMLIVIATITWQIML
jgi:hypothetical protein